MKVPTILGRVHMPAPFRSLFRPQALGATGRFSVRLLGLLVLTLSLPRLNPTSRLHGDVATRIADCQLTVWCAGLACVQCIPCARTSRYRSSFSERSTGLRCHIGRLEQFSNLHHYFNLYICLQCLVFITLAWRTFRVNKSLKSMKAKLG